MQTDLQLLLLIIGLVFGGFILYNTFRHKARKKSSSYEEFETAPPKAAEQPLRHDPLMDDYDTHDNNKVLGKVTQAKPGFNAEELLPAAQSLQNDWAASEQKADTLFESESKLAPEPLFEALKPAPRKMAKPRKAPSEVIALSIIPKQGTFTGAMLSSALKTNQFHYGDHKIFHRHVDDNPKAPILFSVASIVEPGNFEYHHMFNKTYPGVLLWMVLPVANDAMQSFDKLLKSARQLAAFLNGELCDTKRLVLTTEAIATMRERVHQFQVNHEQALEYELEDVR